MSEELEKCMNCGKTTAVVEGYLYAGTLKYAVVCIGCGFRTAIFDRENDARAVWNSMKDRVLAQVCEAQFANPLENALRAKMRELEAENATIRATYLETVALKDEAANLRVSALQVRITALEAALVEIRDLAPTKTRYELSEMADRALNGEVQK